MRPRPSYVPESIVGAPLDFTWEGAIAHIGPVEGMTPLLEAMDRKTRCAYLTLGAGLLEWGAWRLGFLSDVQESVSDNLQLAEALLAFQVDPRYLKREGRPRITPPDQPPALSASLQLGSFMFQATDPNWFSGYYSPIMETFHSAHIVRHILPRPAKQPFAQWLQAVCERLDEVAPKPDEPFRKKATFASEEEYQAFIAPHRGVALPMEVLDPAYPYRPEERVPLLESFLQKLDWRSNRYLRSPDELRGMGFSGEPYRHA